MKRFKDMFEDAPVNATGDAVSTNKPIVRKKKKKDDSGYREVGTPELLKRYVDDTPGQTHVMEGKKDMTAISSWKKKLKNVKGISKDTIQQLSTLPTPVITSLINQIGMIVAGDEDEHPPHVKDKDKEKEKKREVLKGSLAAEGRELAHHLTNVQEARLLVDGKIVTSVDQILGIILKKLKSEMGKKYKQNAKDGLAYINNIARMVGMKATDQKQSKGKLFLKLGEDLEEGAKYTNVHNKIKKIRNLKRTEAEFIANIDPAVLGQVIKALIPMFKASGYKLEETDMQEGLWDNIRKKKARIKAGSGEKMRKKGEKGAPTPDQIKKAQEECCAECLGHYDHMITEAEYQGKKVNLNDPIRTSENPNKKFKVYVKNEKGKVVVVRFGDPKMGINRDNAERRKSFRARHNCADPGPKTKARYWSCYQWRASAKVDN